MTLTDIHARLGNTALLYLLIVSLWGFYRFFRRHGINSSYWGMLAVAELLLLAQAGMGIYMWAIGLRPARSIHILYGLLVPALIPGAYFYTRGRDSRSEILVYATATIITVGLIFRAIFTGEVSL